MVHYGKKAIVSGASCGGNILMRPPTVELLGDGKAIINGNQVIIGTEIDSDKAGKSRDKVAGFNNQAAAKRTQRLQAKQEKHRLEVQARLAGSPSQ